MVTLLSHDGLLLEGTVIDRPNRFVVRVAFDDDPERAFLGDPGALSVLQPGRPILCAPADDPERSTAYDAIAVEADGRFVSLRAALANDLFERALEAGVLPAFEGYTVDRREPPLPDHGRTDFRLETPTGESALVEVKSATHVEAGVAKFPDRQTERGRRHLRSLRDMRANGTETHVVFVIQRPDAQELRPFREVDPDFADLLTEVRAAGVGVHALAIELDPPDYRLEDADVPVDLP